MLVLSVPVLLPSILAGYGVIPFLLIPPPSFPSLSLPPPSVMR
jgi:hypothetical protein